MMSSLWNQYLLIFIGILIVKCYGKHACILEEGGYTNCTVPGASLNLTDVAFNKSTTYKWLIQPPKASKIDLFFRELFLHEDDEITIFRNLNDSNDDKNAITDPIRAQNGTITIMTDELTLVVKLSGKNKGFKRGFDCQYTSSKSCSFTIPPAVTYVSSPKYIGNDTKAECNYVFNKVAFIRTEPLFLFEIYNITASSITLDGTTYKGSYDKNNILEFFIEPNKDTMKIEMELGNKEDYFLLRIRLVDSACSKYIEVDKYPVSIVSPKYALDNGTFGSDCVWIAKHISSSILSVVFTKLDFHSVLDIVAINAGGSEISHPLYQVTTSNINSTLLEELRSSGSMLWISFKPSSFNSIMAANITFHGQGGHYFGGGHISMNSTTGNDTVFWLEVAENKSVLLNFTASAFSYPATVSIYEGFNNHHLIATLHGDIWYPVLSQGNKLMIVATSFNTGSFEADFSGVDPGCLQMSALSNENYVLSGNCNSTCAWVIPPQNVPKSVLLLHLQYLSLSPEDVIEIYKLDDKNPIGVINSTFSHVPHMTFPANTGALVTISRKKCLKEEDVVLVAHSSFVPGCGGVIEAKPNETFHVTSPLYPDTYPLMANCSWTLTSPANSLVHLSFEKLSLAPNHCVKVTNSRTNTTEEYTGSLLPVDIFLSNASSINFYSSACNNTKTKLQLRSSEGFMATGTLAECGAVLETKSGEFMVNVSSQKQSFCMWKVSVPETKDSVNIISYTITPKENKGNYELKVFDGESVKDAEITNTSTTENIWSRTNHLIFSYRRHNITMPSSVFLIQYNTVACNSSMLCANKVCMHPDWRCNGENECGDFTDEKDCASVPIPPEVKEYGYTSSAFWGTVVSMMIIGALLGFGVPVCYQKMKSRTNYHRFGDISSIE